MNKNNDDYIYIIITNYNPVDFQSLIIKYKSWDKFINDIQDVDCKDIIEGTMTGLLHPRNAIAIIDFKDDFHVKYHFNSPICRDSFTYAYCVNNINMDMMLDGKIN